MSVTLHGIKDVERMLESFAPREAKNLLRATIHGVAGDVRDEIKRKAPDDPATIKGDLIRTTKTKRERVKGSFISSTVRIRAFYWLFIERGTVKMAANPFIRRSIMAVEPRLNRIFVTQFGQKLEARLARLTKAR